MFGPLNVINVKALVTEIVSNDYRTADVFRKYGIDFCCGGKWPLQMVCENKGLDTHFIKTELERAMQVIHITPLLPFNTWALDFLADYIVNVHHAYISITLPGLKEHLDMFVQEHRKKYPNLVELNEHFNRLYGELLSHLKQEEELIFPYIRKLYRAYYNRESYAGLLVRTLRKPVEDLMHHGHDNIEKALHYMRLLTDNYTPPAQACISHKVAYLRLRELDNDLVQHVHLENNILFPKAIAIEKELTHKE